MVVRLLTGGGGGPDCDGEVPGDEPCPVGEASGEAFADEVYELCFVPKTAPRTAPKMIRTRTTRPPIMMPLRRHHLDPASRGVSKIIAGVLVNPLMSLCVSTSPSCPAEDCYVYLWCFWRQWSIYGALRILLAAHTGEMSSSTATDLGISDFQPGFHTVLSLLRETGPRAISVGTAGAPWRVPGRTGPGPVLRVYFLADRPFCWGCDTAAPEASRETLRDLGNCYICREKKAQTRKHVVHGGDPWRRDAWGV